MAVGDSIKRKDRPICRKDRDRQTVCCLLSTKIWHTKDQMDQLQGGAVKDPAVMVRMLSMTKVRRKMACRKKNYFKDLGALLKKRDLQGNILRNTPCASSHTR